MDLQTSTNGLINGGLSTSWKVVLAGGNNNISMVNVDQGQQLYVSLVQPSGGNGTVTWPSTLTWASGQAPTLKTTNAGVDVFTFVNEGTIESPRFRDVGGAPSRLPARLGIAALGLMTLFNFGQTFHLTAGSGTGVAEIGRLPAVIDIRSGSGVGVASGTLLAEIDGSGSHKTGKWGGVAVGMNDPKNDRLDALSASAALLPNGNFRTRGTMSGASTLTLSPLGAQPNKIACVKAGGVIGYMNISATGTIAHPYTCN